MEVRAVSTGTPDRATLAAIGGVLLAAMARATEKAERVNARPKPDEETVDAFGSE